MYDGPDEDQMQASVVVGIDEAGYGPLLGPLVVSASAFEVPVAVMKALPSAADGPDLWELLKSGVTPKAHKRDPRLAVADSKKLYGAGGLAMLERAALSFCRQNGEALNSMRALLDRLCPQVANQLKNYPWYADSDVDLPAACGDGDLATQRNSLSNTLSSAGVRFLGAWVEVLPVGRFNRLIDGTRNKAVVLFGQCARLIQRIADELGPRPLRVWVDRHGGRVRYRRPLMTAFEDAHIDVIEESPQRSSYRLNRPRAQWMIRFVRNGEKYHLPVALASIFSKYIRELFMACFNRYWVGQVPGLSPTAGYYQDGKRFLADIDEVITRISVDRLRLVRKR